MNIHRFRLGEMYSNSQGKTSCSLVAAHILIITGCFMGIRGSFTLHGESILQGIAFAAMGTGLLTVRRFTDEKIIPDSVTEKQDNT